MFPRKYFYWDFIQGDDLAVDMPLNNTLWKNFTGEIQSDLKGRCEQLNLRDIFVLRDASNQMLQVMRNE